MRDRTTGGPRTSAFSLCAGFILLLVMSVPPLFAEDQIDLKRDEDKTAYSIGQDTQNRQDAGKTVYSIGPDDRNRREEEKERDKAWDMLKNMRILDNNKGQPSQSGPAQPTQSK